MCAKGVIHLQHLLPPIELQSNMHFEARAYLQVHYWAMLVPHSLDPVDFGWVLDEADGYKPITTLDEIAPEN